MQKAIHRIVSLFCAMVIVVSTMSVCVSAWNSNQQATNSFRGKGTPMVPVVLEKLVKLADGTETEIPIPNTSFYLFSEDDEQIGGLYKTDANGEIDLMLNPGSYYFEEAMPAAGYTYDTVNGENIIRYPFVVAVDDTELTVTAYNRPFSGSLMISKTVENADGSPLTEQQLGEEFTFTVTFSESGSYEYHTSLGKSGTVSNLGTITLKHGERAVFEDLPGGLLYNVTESVPDGYRVSSTGHRGNITETQATAEFVNTYDTAMLGSITITKEVVGENFDPDTEFFFTVNIGSISDEILVLKAGESYTYSGLPFGTEYTIEEKPKENFVSTVTYYSGVVSDADDIKLTFENVYMPEVSAEYGNLSITKVTNDITVDSGKTFKFDIDFEGEGAPQDQTFTLNTNETCLFLNIPNGVTYTITEVVSAGYTPVFRTVSGVVAGGKEIPITFTNKATEEVVITIEKVLGENAPPHSEDREFEFRLTVDGHDSERFVLKAGQSISYRIPSGSEYEIREKDYFADGYSQHIANGFGVAADDVHAVATNTYFGQTVIEISGEKTWDTLGETDVVLPESITVRLLNAGRLTEEQIVTADENGRWLYSFAVPQYNADGSPAEYSVEEAPVTSFRAEYRGFDIVNTYVPPARVTLPPVVKTVVGEEPPDEEFVFILAAAQGTPMPDGSENGESKITITGSGEALFSEISFVEPGEYIYTISELDNEIGGWTYDPAVYTVIVRVVETDTGLSAEYEIQRAHSETDKIEFVNNYTYVDLKEQIIIRGQKTWEHGRNPESQWPEEISVELYANSELKYSVKVTEDNDWKYSFEVPKYDEDGRLIQYAIDESDVPGYAKLIIEYDIVNIFEEADIILPPDEADIVLPADAEEPGVAPSPNKPGSDIPKTGDESNMPLWIGMVVLSIVGLTATLLIGRKPRYRGKHVKRR